MKKIILSLTLFLVFFSAISQEEKKESNNEIKLNVAYLIAGIPEFSYEYILNEESSVGVDILFSIENDIDFKFALTSHYRFFFGEKRAAGFFVEGFGMVNVTENDLYYDYSGYEGGDYSSGENITDFALGVAVGGKFITESGFVFEIYGGIGRNLFNNNDYNNDYEFVPRFGATFGKRF